jgi:integral membrane protein
MVLPYTRCCNMVRFFKHIALWEGISLLLLLFIAMPVKHGLGYDILVKVIGMAHGILFILYVIGTISIKNTMKWSLHSTFLILFLSLVPFGTFYVDKKYL